MTSLGDIIPKTIPAKLQRARDNRGNQIFAAGEKEVHEWTTEFALSLHQNGLGFEVDKFLEIPFSDGESFAARLNQRIAEQIAEREKEAQPASTE
jgi:hypothetical protein